MPCGLHKLGVACWKGEQWTPERTPTFQKCETATAIRWPFSLQINHLDRKRATGFEPATLSLGTCPASAHERQRALFRVFSARGRSPALVGDALLSALPRAR